MIIYLPCLNREILIVGDKDKCNCRWNYPEQSKEKTGFIASARCKVARHSRQDEKENNKNAKMQAVSKY